MKVTISFKNCMNRVETATFDVIPASEFRKLSRAERYDLIGNGYDSIRDEDMDDDGAFPAEKQAIKAAGLELNSDHYYKLLD